MRSFFVPLAALSLAGCVSAPNDPTLTLQTDKSPDDYVLCVLPKLEKHRIAATVTQNSRHVRLVLTSKIAADDVLEVYKAGEGGKVFLYERKPLASTIVPSRLELTAKECQ
ncbi:hypothetical protein AO262_25045 [Pseudomonas fluorescens ABAC62]|nr:hypothetical protein AO262_25045 [Pseudomonas fluorescens ABAC62]